MVSFYIGRNKKDIIVNYWSIGEGVTEKDIQGVRKILEHIDIF